MRTMGRRQSRFAAAVLGLLFLGAGVFLSRLGYRVAVWNLVELTRWLPVEAVVTSTAPATGPQVKDGKRCNRVVEYRYAVDGREYVCDNYDITTLVSMHVRARTHIASQYKVGEKYTAYYNPADPAQAVITREVSYFFVLLLFAGLVFGAAGIAVIVGPTLAGAKRGSPLHGATQGIEIHPEIDDGLGSHAGIVAFLSGVILIILVGLARSLALHLPVLWLMLPIFGLAVVVIVWGFEARKVAACLLQRRRARGLIADLKQAPLRRGETAQWEITDAHGQLAGAEEPLFQLVFRTPVPLYGAAGRDPNCAYAEDLRGQRGTGRRPDAFGGQLTVPPAEPDLPEALRSKGGWYLLVCQGTRTFRFRIPIQE